ncbi:MAG: cytochrome c biogenesis protein CcsA [Dehalococcoidia bacterium]
MADVSLFLTWSGLALAVFAFAAHVATAALYPRPAHVPAPVAAGPKEGGHPGRAGAPAFASALTAATVAVLGTGFATRWWAVGHAPFGNLYEFTAAFAFGVATATLLFSIAVRQVYFALVGLPIVIVSLAVAALFPSDVVPLVPALQNGPLLALHVSVMLAAYAVLTVSFSAAVVYFIQGEGGRVAWLPSRESAEDLAHLTVIVGFPLLLLGIALGAYWANSAWGRYWGWDPKETSALVTLLALAAYFHARSGSGSITGTPLVRSLLPSRLRGGWRPDPMWWLVVTWGLVIFTYFGVNLWISGLHSYAGV